MNTENTQPVVEVPRFGKVSDRSRGPQWPSAARAESAIYQRSGVLILRETRPYPLESV